MEKKFIEIAAKAFRANPQALEERSSPHTIEGWDSLSHWILISDLEDAYNIEFTIEEATCFSDLGGLHDILMTKLR